MLSRLDLRAFTGDLRTALAPPPDEGEGPVAAVREIIAAVRARGDDALRELTARYDGCEVGELRVASAEVAAGLDRVPSAVRNALEYAAGEIRAYHETQLTPDTTWTRDGVVVQELVRPVERVGCYAPGGRAPLASTVLMTAIPARVAGVPEVIVCSPPDRDGRVPAPVLAAAAIAGVDDVYRVGGAQAIAAMAYGTASITPVDVIVGPGNRYVALAKREVAGVVGIESLAGPSELVVIADGTADARHVALDLMAQAEHGPGGAAVLVAWDEGVVDAVEAALVEEVARAARRAEIESTLGSGGRAVLVDDAAGALAVSNTIAPEHLQLMTAAPEELLPGVRNAGAVFCGPWAPAVVGDYVVGVNHVLPTARTARYASALRVDDFRKHVHAVTLDRAALDRVAPHVAALAGVEGLAAHAAAVAARGGGR
ncbi:MAG: histidinol dehydrogenase [Acidimicrobiia bacterium]